MHVRTILTRDLYEWTLWNRLATYRHLAGVLSRALSLLIPNLLNLISELPKFSHFAFVRPTCLIRRKIVWELGALFWYILEVSKEIRWKSELARKIVFWPWSRTHIHVKERGSVHIKVMLTRQVCCRHIRLWLQLWLFFLISCQSWTWFVSKMANKLRIFWEWHDWEIARPLDFYRQTDFADMIETIREQCPLYVTIRNRI